MILEIYLFRIIHKRIGADSMKNKNNLGGNRNISEKTCASYTLSRIMTGIKNEQS